MSILKNSPDDLFLLTQIGFIIDDCFNRNWKLIFFFNQIYLMQAIWLTLFEINQSDFSQIMTLVTAILIILIQGLQMKLEGSEYFRKLINFVNLTGNFMVLFRVFDQIESFNWLIIIFVYIKAVQSIRIFGEIRQLFHTIVEISVSVIPFVLTMMLSFFIFAFLMISMDENERDAPFS